MTFSEIAKQIADLQQKSRRVDANSAIFAAWNHVCSAEENANDTLDEKSCTEEEWDAIALATLEMLLGTERNAKVTRLFTSRGFRF